MKLATPFIITARLLPGVEINGAYISIEANPQTNHRRCSFSYYIDLPNGHSYEGHDLSRFNNDPQAAMGDVLDFLACGSEFDPEIDTWAAENQDDLAVLRCIVEETPDLITA